ncbi:monocarboxylate transporter 10 isoform X2 [Belonocnema kinseyi]|uniref:monocarboxylate transporter 10 isoform X2 n=1 Tax=Belonocnema kinseyi TaxID=2817044 RepID=UPI00143CEA5C|nr:monocarboxylate transporter 10 isoform X2 [Belonocnema kinseyi]
MVVAENEDSKQASNSDLSNASSNAKCESNDRSYEQQNDVNLHKKNRSITNENNSLLLDASQVQPEILGVENMIKAQKVNGLINENDKGKSGVEDLENSPCNGKDDPPDGGARAWLIMIGSFIINGVLFSVINSYSVIYGELNENMKRDGINDTASKASLVGSLQLGTTFCMSPLAGILTNKIGIQMTTFLGGLIATLGMFLSSFFLDTVECLYLTYGIMYGVGASLAYAPSLVILGHYFKRYLGLVNGIVTAGSSIFTIVMPYLMKHLLKEFGLKVLVISLGSLTCIVMACACLFKPVSKPLSPVAEKPKKVHQVTFCEKLKGMVNLSILKRKRYLIWASAMPIALLGYQTPYIHVGKFVETHFGKDANQAAPIMCLGVTSGIGRLIFGYIADLPRVNRILLQQISFMCLGSLMMLMAFTSSYTVLIIIYLCMGLFDGCFISLLGPIAFEICGQKDATSAISFLLGLCALPVTIGSLFAGYLYDRSNSYSLTFVLSGVPSIVAALAMFAVRFVKEDPVLDSVDPAGQSLTTPAWINDNSKPVPNSGVNGAETKTEEKELEDFHCNGSAPVSA